MTRDANRAAAPLMTAAIDEIRASGNPADVTVRWVQEGAFEIGKRPALERGLFEISGESYERLMAEPAPRKGRAR